MSSKSNREPELIMSVRSDNVRQCRSTGVRASTVFEHVGINAVFSFRNLGITCQVESRAQNKTYTDKSIDGQVSGEHESPMTRAGFEMRRKMIRSSPLLPDIRFAASRKRQDAVRQSHQGLTLNLECVL